MSLEFDQLREDPRVKEARNLLLAALKEHRGKLTSVRPPQENLIKPYEQLLNQFSAIRGSKLWFPYIGSGLGNGGLVELLDGSVKYDFICGIGPHYFGHSHPLMTEAAFTAALSDTIMQGNLQQNEEALRLSQVLCQTSGFAHCFLSTSGAMANENALKIAFQKRYPAARILAFERCFVGRTLALSQITDKPAFREGLPNTVEVDYVPYFDATQPEESTLKAVEALKKHLHRYPKQHAVMIFELVQGEGGFHAGSREFFMSLIEVLKQEEILIFDDEVQCFGRLSELFAFQYFDIKDHVDIVTIGKLSQTCATLFTDRVNPKPGLLSQTFTAAASSIQGGLAVLQELQKGNYYGSQGKIERLYRHFTAKLEAYSKSHPQLLKGPYGLGSMLAFTPLDGSPEKVNAFVHELFQAGVMTFVAGQHPTRCRMLLPVGAIEEKDIDAAFEIIAVTLQKMGG